LRLAAPPSKQVNKQGRQRERMAGVLRDHVMGRATIIGRVATRVLQSGMFLGSATCVGLAAILAFSSAATHVRAEGLPEALAKAYQTNPQLLVCSNRLS